jgi:Trk K+ transport system NAD-binding subunit
MASTLVACQLLFRCMSHVIVCGFGQVGYRVVTLLQDLGEHVTVVTLEGREEWMRHAQERGARIFRGDARDEAFLEQCGLLDAKAIIACTDDDSANIEISLDARRLRPGIRLITRLSESNLRRQAETHLGVDRAIAMALAAAPAFAAATFGDRVLSEFTAGEERMLVLRYDGPVVLDEPPLVVISGDGADISPSSLEIKEGESAVVVVSAGSVFGSEVRQPQGLLKSLLPVNIFHVVRDVWKNTSVQLRAVFLAILSVILVSVIVFQVGMHLSTVDAFYFVVTTATTTGYGDISPKDASVWVKLYACGMMVMSAAGMAVLFSMVTDYIVTARLMQLVGRQRIPEKNHVLVVGIGSVGNQAVDELLRMGSQVVVVDASEDNDYLGSLRSRVPVVIGDAREVTTLHRAAVDKARAMVVTGPEDAVNLSIGLAAKELNPKLRVVLRIFDAEFAMKVQTLPEVDAALSASRLAAPAYVGATLYSNAVASFRLGPHFFTLCDDAAGKVLVAGHKMKLHGRGLAEVSLKRGNAGLKD